MLVLASCQSPQARETNQALRRLNRRQPSAQLAPQEVVRIQMEALKYNDARNRGIEIAFRFASPSNKVNTGPLPRFIAMINGDAYRPMLEYNAIEYDEIQVLGDQAAQRLAVTTDDGLIIVYVFVLSRQEGEDCSGCWMTDAVYIQSVRKSDGVA
jgi:hypothetical protein